MTFQITYRGADGARTEETVEAASRAACLAQLKARGIAAVSVREGASGGGARRRWIVPAVLGALGVAGLALLLAFFAAREAPGPVAVPKAKPPARPKVEKRPAAVLTNMVVEPVPVVKQEEVLPPWNESFTTNREMRLKYSTLFKAITNEGGLVIERYRLPNGKTWRRIVEPPPVFTSISDQAIAMVVGGAAGSPIPPVPGLDDANLDEEFAKSLSVPIEIGDDDPPRIVALKMAVKQARDEIEQLIRSGDKRTVGQMLSEHIATNNRQAGLKAEALAAVRRVREQEGEEAAAEYLKAVNEHLKGYGVKPVQMGERRKQQ